MARGDIEAARRRIAAARPSTPVLETGSGRRSAWRCRLDAQARAAAAHGVVQAAGGVQQDAHVRRAGGGRRRRERRELRARGGLRRARARPPRRDLRPLHVARREDRPGPRAGRRRPRDRRATTTTRRRPRARGRRERAPSRCIRSISRRWWRAGHDRDRALRAGPRRRHRARGRGRRRADRRDRVVVPRATSGWWPWNRRPRDACDAALEAGRAGRGDGRRRSRPTRSAPRRVGEIAFAAARAYVDRVVLVSDDAIREAQRALWRELHLVAEPGGAATLAALMSGAYRPARG